MKQKCYRQKLYRNILIKLLRCDSHTYVSRAYLYIYGFKLIHRLTLIVLISYVLQCKPTHVNKEFEYEAFPINIAVGL